MPLGQEAPLGAGGRAGGSRLLPWARPLGPADILGQAALCWEVLCVTGCLTASLSTTHEAPGLPSQSRPLKTFLEIAKQTL